MMPSGIGLVGADEMLTPIGPKNSHHRTKDPQTVYSAETKSHVVPSQVIYYGACSWSARM